MRKLFLLSLVLFGCLPLPAFAQEGPAGEVFGGFSLIPSDEGTLYGFHTSVAGNVRGSLGLAGDFSGTYSKVDVGLANTIDVSAYSFLFGPRFSARGQKATGFVHFLFGGTRVSGGYGGVSASETGFQTAMGGGLDLRAGDRLTVRAVQADILTSHLAGMWGRDLRLSFGIVVPFGR